MISHLSSLIDFMEKIEATILDLKSSKIKEWIGTHLSSFVKNDAGYDYNPNPIIIKSNFYSFFQCLEDAVLNRAKLIGRSNASTVHHNIKATLRKKEKDINYLLNSSIWIRFCDEGAEHVSLKEADALEEIKWFQELGLYDYKAAQEYIEYQFRSQKDNYLAEIKGKGSGGHGVHITPTVYSDEVEFRNFFLGDKSTLPLKFKFLVDKGDGFHAEDVNLRILLVDDKIGGDSPKDCNNCENCDSFGVCKLRIIKELLSGGFIQNKDKKNAFCSKTYWDYNVDAKYSGSVSISHVWSNVSGKIERNDEFVANLGLKAKSGVQIVGAPDLESALSLLSCCKFDIILLDYLLGPRSNDDPTRTYSTELFEFLSYGFEKEETIPEILEMLRKTSSFSDEQLKEFQNNVKLNRGPLDKFWIIPMTSYNSSFITDLQRKHVRLIDHRWNISQGADPINTPWKFLYKINECIDLQLRSCVFHLDELLEFLTYNCEDFEDLFKRKNGKLEFHDFQSFMGAEFADFIRRYGNRHLIQRDAVSVIGGESSENESLLSTYVWDSFYDNRIYRAEIELNRLIQRFLQHVASMHNDRYGRQRLEEAFGQLCFFIESNKKIQDCINNNRSIIRLHENLRTMRIHMEQLMNQSRSDI